VGGQHPPDELLPRRTGPLGFVEVDDVLPGATDELGEVVVRRASITLPSSAWASISTASRPPLTSETELAGHVAWPSRITAGSPGIGL
jgi:hypothetical protein